MFVDLYREGLIYKDKRLVNWDCQLQTAVSDLEVEPTEVDGQLWYIRYPIEGERRPPRHGRDHPARDHARRHRASRSTPRTRATGT